MKHLKRFRLFESVYSIEEYISAVCDELAKYNIKPVDVKSLINNLEIELRTSLENDITPLQFVNDLQKDMNLGSGGYPSHMINNQQTNTSFL